MFRGRCVGSGRFAALCRGTLPTSCHPAIVQGRRGLWPGMGVPARSCWKEPGYAGSVRTGHTGLCCVESPRGVHSLCLLLPTLYNNSRLFCRNEALLEKNRRGLMPLCAVGLFLFLLRHQWCRAENFLHCRGSDNTFCHRKNQAMDLPTIDPSIWGRTMDLPGLLL